MGILSYERRELPRIAITDKLTTAHVQDALNILTIGLRVTA